MKTFRRLILFILIVLSACTFTACSFFSSNDYSSQINEISINKMSANVKILNSRRAYSQNGIRTDEIMGSGAIVAKDKDNFYYFITNYHVVDFEGFNSQTLKVVDHMGNSTTLDSSWVLFKDKTKDLALLKFYSSRDLSVLKIAKSYAETGDTVFALGAPNGQLNSVTIGVLISKISAPIVDGSTRLETDDKKPLEVYNHDAPIFGGSSGGMLLNIDLNLMAINYAGTTADDGKFVSGYAIPSPTIIEFLEKTNAKNLIEII